MGGGIAACLISLLFASCVNSEYDGRTDTVYALNTPSVTAKAYPGVNIVTWKPVSGAQSYKIYIYEENVYKHETVVWDDYIFYDTDLINGKNYKYYVEAVGKDNLPAREVYVTDSSRGEASARAIVPPAGTKSLDLPAYENGYDGSTKTTDSSDQYVVTSSNISLSVVDGKVIVNFPMKAYLKYKVKYYDNALSEKINYGKSGKENIFSYDNNTTKEVSFPIEYAGTYGIAIEAEAWNKKYATSDPVVYNHQIKVDEFDIDMPSIEQETLDGKLYICFEPATKNEEPVPLGWYKIYIHNCDSFYSDYSELDSGSILVRDDYYPRNLKYYVDCSSLIKTTNAYKVIVVVSDGEKYSARDTIINPSSSETLNVGLPDSVTANYDEDYHSRVRVEFAQASQNGNYVPYNWYMIYRYDVYDDDYEQLKVSLEYNSDNGRLIFYDYPGYDNRLYEYVIIVTDGILLSEAIRSNQAMPYFTSDDIEFTANYSSSNDSVTLTITCKSDVAKKVDVYARYSRTYYSDVKDNTFYSFYPISLPDPTDYGDRVYEVRLSRSELNVGDYEEPTLYFYVKAGVTILRDSCFIPVKQFD